MAKYSFELKKEVVNSCFLFVYDTEQGEIGEYNFIDNPEKFMLKMKREVFNASKGEKEYNAYKNLFLL